MALPRLTRRATVTGLLIIQASAGCGGQGITTPEVDARSRLRSFYAAAGFEYGPSADDCFVRPAQPNVLSPGDSSRVRFACGEISFVFEEPADSAAAIAALAGLTYTLRFVRSSEPVPAVGITVALGAERDALAHLYTAARVSYAHPNYLAECTLDEFGTPVCTF